MSGTICLKQIQKKIKNHRQVFRLVSDATFYSKKTKPIKAPVVHYLNSLSSYDEKQLVRGKLCQLNNTYFFIQDKKNIKVNNKAALHPIIKNYNKKNALLRKIKAHTSSKLTQDLFSHLLLAVNPLDTFLYDLFSNFGLTHILVISGFHFGLLLTVLSLFLHPFIKKKMD